MSAETSVDLDSSSSGSEDDESDSTGTESTATCSAILPGGEPLSLNGIGTINMDRCQESHIGPKIVTDNLNIILSNPKDFGLVEHITKNYEPLDWERAIGYDAKNMVTDEKLQNPPYGRKSEKVSVLRVCQWGPRKTLMFCTVFLILVTIIVVLSVFFGLKSDYDGGNSTAVTTETAVTTQTAFTAVTPPITEPTDDAHTTVTSTPTYGQRFKRSQWNGMDPPPLSYRETTPISYIALDNLQGNHCFSLETCSTLLRQQEKAENGPLNYDYLIDDSGNVYEARGMQFMSDYTFPGANPKTTIKVAFIGNYTEHHLTPNQIWSFQKYIQSEHNDAEMEGQCCRGLENESGPSENVICDINKIGYVKAKRCSNCEWSLGHLNCTKRTAP